MQVIGVATVGADRQEIYMNAFAYSEQHSFSFSCSSLETSGLTSIGKTSETSSSEKVTRRRLKHDVLVVTGAQFNSGETSRSGCSGDRGGDLRKFEFSCSISSSESITVLIESKLRLLEI